MFLLFKVHRRREILVRKCLTHANASCILSAASVESPKMEGRP
jgi:hypothetical protein